MSDHELTPDDQMLAAEFALGVLSGRDHSAARARFDTDADFRAAVEELGSRLAPLAEDIAPQSPTRDLLTDLMAAIRQVPQDVVPAAAEQGDDQPDDGAPQAGLARPDGGAQQAGGEVVPFRRRMLVRFGPLVAAIAASLLIVAIILWPGERPTMVAELTGETAIGLEWHGEERVFVLALEASAVPEGRVAELWAIPEGGSPISLGLRDAEGSVVRPPAELLQLIGDGLTLAVSLEPPGGSPGIGPSGPVIASGVLRPA